MQAGHRDLGTENIHVEVADVGTATEQFQQQHSIKVIELISQTFPHDIYICISVFKSYFSKQKGCF